MEIVKYKIEEEEYVFVENIKIGYLKLIRCVSNKGKNVFIKKDKKLYKKINNRILLNILDKKYKYNIKTDIYESNNER